MMYRKQKKLAVNDKNHEKIDIIENNIVSI